jgi:hypothetical protein
MAQGKNIAEFRLLLIALFSASGVCLIAVAWPLLPRNLGYCLWLAGCGAIGAAGWLIPHRFTAGMLVGAATLAQVPATVAIYKKKLAAGEPKPKNEVSEKNAAESRTLAVPSRMQ